MQIIDRGSGPPLVLVTGIQGRWEYLLPAVEALSRHLRVLTFSLAGEPTAECPFDPQRGIDAFADQIEAALDQSQIDRAVICGVSFGGLPALRFAASRPSRTRALVLVSTPGPQWHLLPRHRMYAHWPMVFGLPFLIESPLRLRPEVSVSFPRRAAWWAFIRAQLRILVRAPISLRRLAARALAVESYDRVLDCTRVSCPTLIVHGESDLDRIVNVDGTQEYARLISGARLALLPRTGHLGSVTRPQEFSAAIERFLATLTKDRHDSAA